MFLSSCLLLLPVALLTVVHGSYFPPYIEGTPKEAQVTAYLQADYRGERVYDVIFTVTREDGAEERGFIHRNYGEFQLLDQEIPCKKEFPWTDPRWELPIGDEVTIASLNDVINTMMSFKRCRESIEMADFLGINWNAQGVEWFESMATFMHMLLLARVPLFPPQPPLITSELDVTAPETPFEKYVYLLAFKQDDIDEYTAFFKNYTLLTPSFDPAPGVVGDTDVRPPWDTSELQLPYHYTTAYVHFLPGGYTNGQTVRVSFCGQSKFNFLKPDILHEWITKEHGHLKPKRILDMGTGNCHSAFAFAQIFPDAEVIGIDLAAPYIRFCRMWAEQKGIKNVNFYQDNAEMTSFESSSFDVIQYSYVLHEMPSENALMVLEEGMRLLRPGGVMSGFEVPFREDPVVRAYMVATQTWGYKWNSTGPHGPEPFAYEYQERFVIPTRLQQAGYVNITEIPYTLFDGIYLAYKPHLDS